VIALLAFLSLLAIEAVPLSLEILERISGRSLAMAPGTIAQVVLTRTMLPLATGMLVLLMFPRVAPRIEKAVTLLAAVLLPLAALMLTAASASEIWALVGDGTVVAMVLFVVIGLVVGHAMGDRDPHFTTALALATAYRHPAMAFSIAATNFPEQRFAGPILLYVIVSFLIGVLYVAWQRRRLNRPNRPRLPAPDGRTSNTPTAQRRD
jgi:BASS family bile acid:Na+ symporter